MSYSFRNRPKLSDRYRGKSGDEILNELKNQIDEDRKMFFESSPGWNSVQSPGSFSRAGHPLDDMMSRGRQDIRSHLDDLAQRHPEFADHLRCPPWGGEMGASSRGTWGRKRRGSGSSGDDITNPESPMPESSEEASPSRGRSRQNNLPQYGLRNTVDLGQQQQQCEDQEKGRGQRSWSAPPDNRTQNPPDPPRFVSRLDIPVNPMPSNPGTDQGKPPVAPKQQPPQQPQQSHNVPQQPQQHPSNTGKPSQQQGGNVRHIPIFVEGRDEPLLPKASAAATATDAPTERVFTERVPPQPTSFNYGRPSFFTARQNQQPPPPPPPTPHMPQPSPQMPQQTAYTQQATPPKARTSAQQQVPPNQPPPASQQPRQENQEQQQEPVLPKSTPQPQKQTVANDPISRVQAIQKDVDELKRIVDNYSGNSRKDKDYMYLDEMLTRHLLKLDNIETDGKEDVRQARKSVIRNIQQCISILESKVPSPDEVCPSGAEEVVKSEHGGEQSSGQISDTCPESGLNKTKMCSEASLPQKSPEISGQKMEAENCQTELAMEAEPVPSTVKESDEKAQSQPDNQEGPISKSDEKDLVQEGSEKSENVSNKEGECSLQLKNMQGDEKTVDGEQMEVDTSCSKETLPVPGGEERGDEKATGLSSKVDGSPNKSIKTKSPKGSPKKGKRTT